MLSYVIAETFQPSWVCMKVPKLLDFLRKGWEKVRSSVSDGRGLEVLAGMALLSGTHGGAPLFGYPAGDS